MFQRYVHKYLVVCNLALIIVVNAVADISLDYYFGNDEPLRSTDDLGACQTEQLKNSCYETCGPIHACLLGQCFCVQLNTLQEKDEELVLAALSEDNIAPESYEEGDRSRTSSKESYLNYEELAVRPTLRHHIAHFCPNLDDARVCIRKCMKVGKPAFCGKDHHCYCGHHYDFPGVEPNLTAADVQDQFRDLYEKYFGPKKSKVVKMHHHSHKD